MTRCKDEGKQLESKFSDGMDDVSGVDKAKQDDKREEEEDGEEVEDEDEEEEEEEEEEEAEQQQQHLITDYEKQREQRIKENAAKLAALNLPHLASSFQNSGHRSTQKFPAARLKRFGRRKKFDADDTQEDEDYRPSDPSSDSETEDSDNEQSRPRANDMKQVASDSLDQEENGNEDEDWALQKALALSLGASLEEVADKSGCRQSPKGELLDGVHETKGYNVKAGKDERQSRHKRQISGSNNASKRQRKGMKKQIQFTDHEVAGFFSLIDEQGGGKFSVTELEQVASAHDFTWSKQELLDMIDVFDSNRDGKLDFTEFRGMLVIGNMLKMPSDE